MGGFCHGALHIELKHALRGGRPLLAQAQFGWIAGARIAIANEIHISMRIGRWPMVHEILQEVVPTGNPKALHIAQGKRESMIDPNDHRITGLKQVETILGNLQSGPVFCTLGRCTDLYRFSISCRCINLQSLESTGGRLRAGVVDTNMTGESHGFSLW